MPEWVVIVKPPRGEWGCYGKSSKEEAVKSAKEWKESYATYTVGVYKREGTANLTFSLV